MLNRLIDLGLEFIGLFQIYTFIDEYDEAVVLRYGKYIRTIGPGFRWLWPLNIERTINVNVKPEPMYLDTQSLHTKDDYLINIQVGITYQVTSPKTFLLDFENTEDTIAMLISGLVTEAVHRAKWSDMRNGVWSRGLKTRSNRICSKRGAKVNDIIVQDLANGDANRLWIEGVEL